MSFVNLHLFCLNVNTCFEVAVLIFKDIALVCGYSRNKKYCALRRVYFLRIRNCQSKKALSKIASLHACNMLVLHMQYIVYIRMLVIIEYTVHIVT